MKVNKTDYADAVVCRRLIERYGSMRAEFSVGSKAVDYPTDFKSFNLRWSCYDLNFGICCKKNALLVVPNDVVLEEYASVSKEQQSPYMGKSATDTTNPPFYYFLSREASKIGNCGLLRLGGEIFHAEINAVAVFMDNYEDAMEELDLCFGFWTSPDDGIYDDKPTEDKTDSQTEDKSDSQADDEDEDDEDDD